MFFDGSPLLISKNQKWAEQELRFFVPRLQETTLNETLVGSYCENERFWEILLVVTKKKHREK